MLERTIKKIINELNQRGVRDRDITVFEHLNLIVGLRPEVGTAYLVYDEKYYNFSLSELADVDHSYKVDSKDSGSLGATLLGGALFGDAGAIIGSGLLSPDKTTESVEMIFRFYDMAPLTFTNVIRGDADYSYDLSSLEDLFEDIISENRRKYENGEYRSSGVTRVGSSKKKLKGEGMSGEEKTGIVVCYIVSIFFLIMLWLIAR